MKLGLHYWNYSTPSDPTEIAPTLAETVRVAEQAGFSGGLRHGPLLPDGHGGCARPTSRCWRPTPPWPCRGLTERMTLGVLVSGVMYRHPGLLAKIVTTLDVLGGRARLGVGASWYEREQAGSACRSSRWRSGSSASRRRSRSACRCGATTTARSVAATTSWPRRSAPRPISQPHPPIQVGGGGEKKTLLLVARYADASNVFGTIPADVAGKLDVLRSHCEAEGRDYDRIEKTVLAMMPALADVDGFVAAAAEYAAPGVTEIEVMPDRHPVDSSSRSPRRSFRGSPTAPTRSTSRSCVQC